MRPLALVLAAAVAVGSAAPVAAEIMEEAPHARWCATPARWPAIAKCLRDRVGPTKIHPRTTPRTQLVTINEYERQVYVQQVNGLWRRVWQLLDAHYKVVEERAIHVGKQSALRVELRHQVSTGGARTILEKIALVCPGNDACRALVYACIVMSHGRAIETFLGEVAITPDAITVTGDRSQSGSYCSSR